MAALTKPGARPAAPLASAVVPGKRAKALQPVALNAFADDSDVEEDGTLGGNQSAGVASKEPRDAPGGAEATALRFKEMGQQHAEASDWARALSSWDQALAHMPAKLSRQHAELLELRAQVLLEMGREYEAIMAAVKAISLTPSFVEAHMTLARAQVNFGEPRLAVKSLLRVLQLQPEHAEAKAELATVQMLSLQQERLGVGRRAHVHDPGALQNSAAAAGTADSAPVASGPQAGNTGPVGSTTDLTWRDVAGGS